MYTYVQPMKFLDIFCFRKQQEKKEYGKEKKRGKENEKRRESVQSNVTGAGIGKETVEGDKIEQNQVEVEAEAEVDQGGGDENSLSIPYVYDHVNHGIYEHMCLRQC